MGIYNQLWFQNIFVIPSYSALLGPQVRVSESSHPNLHSVLWSFPACVMTGYLQSSSMSRWGFFPEINPPAGSHPHLKMGCSLKTNQTHFLGYPHKPGTPSCHHRRKLQHLVDRRSRQDQAHGGLQGPLGHLLPARLETCLGESGKRASEEGVRVGISECPWYKCCKPSMEEIGFQKPSSIYQYL